jgi:hypothetical protein
VLCDFFMLCPCTGLQSVLYHKQWVHAPLSFCMDTALIVWIFVILLWPSGLIFPGFFAWLLTASIFCGLCTLGAHSVYISNTAHFYWNCCWSLWIDFGADSHCITKGAWNHLCLTVSLPLSAY